MKIIPTRTIRLTNSPKVALVSPCDYGRVIERSWHLSNTGYPTTSYYKNKKVSLHRFILGKLGEDVDHVKGNKLDNRRSKIRLCSHHQNMMNRGPQKNNSSGYKGVSKSASLLNPWVAKIKVGTVKHLGNYATREAAALAYNKAAENYFKEFAFVNKVPPRIKLAKNRLKKSSKYLGIWWSKTAKKWAATVSVQNSNIHLGYYVSEIEAAKVRDRFVRKAKTFHGLNFPDETEKCA